MQTASIEENKHNATQLSFSQQDDDWQPWQEAVEEVEAHVENYSDVGLTHIEQALYDE